MSSAYIIISMLVDVLYELWEICGEKNDVNSRNLPGEHSGMGQYVLFFSGCRPLGLGLIQYDGKKSYDFSQVDGMFGLISGGGIGDRRC